MMGKGKRNGRSKYRIVVHSAKYMKQKKEQEALRKRVKDMKEGNIFTGEMKVMLPIILPGKDGKSVVLTKTSEEIFHGEEVNHA